MAALLNWKVMGTHTKSEDRVHSPFVTPNKMGKLRSGGAQFSGDTCKV